MPDILTVRYPPFRKDMTFTPAYLELPLDVRRAKVEALEDILRNCTLCPRRCGADRTAGGLGFCRTGDKP